MKIEERMTLADARIWLESELKYRMALVKEPGKANEETIRRSKFAIGAITVLLGDLNRPHKPELNDVAQSVLRHVRRFEITDDGIEWVLPKKEAHQMIVRTIEQCSSNGQKRGLSVDPVSDWNKPLEVQTLRAGE